MRPLNSSELLQVWEDSLGQPLLERALRLLSIACSIPNRDLVAKMSIGDRDARLLQLREWIFGTQLLNIDHCPQCSEKVEWECLTSDLLLQPIHKEIQTKVFQLDVDDMNIEYRLPNSEDMRWGSLHEAELTTHKEILRRCILKIQRKGKSVGLNQLTDQLFEILDQQMAEVDPQAHINMILACPECQHEWSAVFDILIYLWKEIDQWAHRLLQEVYVLARAFHWSEQDILNMSAHRRQLYLEMLRS